MITLQIQQVNIAEKPLLKRNVDASAYGQFQKVMTFLKFSD